jgi:DNA-binding CsgD family transcriptional regulator/ligand-binding sensor protein
MVSFYVHPLQVECTMFFQENPYTFETIDGLAIRLGRNLDDLRPIIEQLVAHKILETIGGGYQTIYRYIQPVMVEVEGEFMERNTTFLQDIQDAYANLAHLPMLIMDKNGNGVTELSNCCPFTKKIYEERVGNREIFESVIQLLPINNTVILDSTFGLKFIISPIRKKRQITGYLYAGYILEPSTREYVCEYLQQKSLDSKELLDALAIMKEHSEDEKNESLKIVRKLINVIEEYLANKETKVKSINFSSSLFDNLESIRSGNATPISFLTKFKENNNQLDFVGLALAQESDYFFIDTIIGKDTEKLKGHTFLIGEGFLGHTIAIQTFQFWEDATSDPRINLYIQKELHPQSIFCMPIYSNNSIKGVLFGGSTNSKLDEQDIYGEATNYSSLLSLFLTTKSLKENLQNHLMELAAFNELFRVITTMGDLKRVLHILVDISINIVRGSFACLVFKPAINQAKIEIVSRGLTSSEINDYGYQVAVNAFSGTEMNNEFQKPRKNKTSWNIEVLEFPLLFNNQLYGILCVGVSQNDDPETYKSFLSSLAIAGGMSIHLHQNNKEKGTDDYTIKLLSKVIENLDPSKHLLATKISKLVEGFATTHNINNANTLKQAGLLIAFDFPFIKEYINSVELVSILEGCKRVLQGERINRRDCELITLIYHYFMENEDPESVKQLTNINEELHLQFSSFIKRENIIESEISLITIPYVNENQQGFDSSELYKKLNITSRELDVLNLVLKGCNNNEIASTLFISDHTVKNHMTKILQKLGVSDRSQAIAKIYQMGFSPPT